MNQSFIKLLFLLPVVLLAACIKTETISQVLEPALGIEPGSVSLSIGQMRQLTGTFTDETGEDQSALIQWSTTDPAVVAVSAGGLLNALAPGQAWVVASVPGGLSDSSLVTVIQNDNSVANVVVSASQGLLEVGATLQLSAKAYNGNNQEITGQSITWLSSDATVLSVNSAGLAVGQTAGNTTVTAAVAGVSSLPYPLQVIAAGGASRSGMFSGNMGYSVSGTATLQQTTGSLKLILGSNFQASNGPQLGVYLAKNATGSLNAQNSLKLANLLQPSGMQEYTVPAGAGLNDYNYVVIYCIPFTVRFGTAQLM